MSSPSSLSIAQATAVTCLSVLTALLAFIASFERIFVARCQHDDSPYASTRTLLWQHPVGFYYLWLLRGTMGIIACLLPLPAMWVEIVLEQRHGGTQGIAIVWATSALIACIGGGIAGERLLYLGLTESLNAEQLACTLLSILAVLWLIVSELRTLVPLPLAWAVTGCALHRLSMVLWWYVVSSKSTNSRQFRDRARLTLAGHGVAFACVFLVFLPVFETGVARLFWLFAVFFAVELITTAQAARMTYSNWVAERAALQRHRESDNRWPVPSISITISSPAPSSEVPWQRPSSAHASSRETTPGLDAGSQRTNGISLTEMRPGMSPVVDSDQISFGAMLREVEESGVESLRMPDSHPIHERERQKEDGEK